MNLKNISFNIFTLLIVLFVLVNVKTVSAKALTQPIIGTITSINSGTERIEEILRDETEETEDKHEQTSKVSHEEPKPIVNEKNEDISEEGIEIFNPVTENDEKSNYNNKNQEDISINKDISQEIEVFDVNSKYSVITKTKNNDYGNSNKQSSDKTKIIAAAGGGVLKVDTGDGGEIKNKISGADIGFIRELKTSSGQLKIGGIVDYNHNSYDNNASGIEGSGKSEALTIGIIAKRIRDDGVYYEGSARLGRAKTDFNSNSFVIDDTAFRVKYEESAPVYAGHAKIGKVIHINDDKYADIYGVYSFSHQDRMNLKSSEGGNIRFGSIDSNKLKTGCRMTTKVKNGKIYYGLAYQYETSAKLKATHNGNEIDISSGRGSSGLVELGYKISADKDKTMNIDLNATGFAGHQKGFIIQAQFIKMI